MESIRGVLGFVETVAAGSFAGAARKLGITPVAVSKNVQRLEKELGVRLLQRSTRCLSLTDEGRLFHQRCLGPLQALASAHAEVKDQGAVAAGVVRVTSVSPFGRNYVVPLLPEFARRHPKVRIELDLDDSVSDMIGQRYDVGIRVGEPQGNSMVAREIAPLCFVICAAPDYLAIRGTPVLPADLARHNCLRMRSPGTGRAVNWALGADRASVMPPVEGDLVTNDMTALVTAALHGQGLALAPLPLVLPLLRAGALVAVMTGWLATGAHVFIHYPNRKNLPARVRVLVNFLLEQLRANPDVTGDPQQLLRPTQSFLSPPRLGSAAPAASDSRPALL